MDKSRLNVVTQKEQPTLSRLHEHHEKEVPPPLCAHSSMGCAGDQGFSPKPLRAPSRLLSFSSCPQPVLLLLPGPCTQQSAVTQTVPVYAGTSGLASKISRDCFLGPPCPIFSGWLLLTQLHRYHLRLSLGHLYFLPLCIHSTNMRPPRARHVRKMRALSLLESRVQRATESRERGITIHYGDSESTERRNYSRDNTAYQIVQLQLPGPCDQL